jgi:hypothetical protein
MLIPLDVATVMVLLGVGVLVTAGNVAGWGSSDPYAPALDRPGLPRVAGFLAIVGFLLWVPFGAYLLAGWITGHPLTAL